MDDLVVQYIVSTYPKESGTRLQIGSTPLVTRPLHFAIRRTRPDAQSIVARFNAQIRGMIADRTYHRLLHVDWIRADVDGDGVSEYVPARIRPGREVPQRVYALFTPPAEDTNKPGFYVGGTIYSDWASVPEAYRNLDTSHPDSEPLDGQHLQVLLVSPSALRDAICCLPRPSRARLPPSTSPGAARQTPSGSRRSRVRRRGSRS